MEDRHKKIEQHFAGELSEKERQALEKQLAEDPELAQAFQLEKDLMAGIEAVGNDKLREQLGQIHQEEIEHKQPPKVRSLRRYNLWAIAAILVVGLLGLVWWLMAPPRLTAEGLYAEYAEYSFDFTDKGDAELLVKAENYLDEGTYEKALPLLEEYLENDPNETVIKCAEGVCRLELGDIEQARSIFESLLENVLFKNEAYWYLALTHLKEKDLKSAKLYLEKIDSNSSRYPKAESLLMKLNLLVS